jgi:hypothetical protein
MLLSNAAALFTNIFMILCIPVVEMQKRGGKIKHGHMTLLIVAPLHLGSYLSDLWAVFDEP